ncbi:NUDIX hydrolase [Pseudothermotoga thermarum]|nr:CoA pyrophosphatase [Pseudothermotoga thermarum]
MRKNLAAVCVPLIYIQKEPHIVFVKRSRKLKRHPGQIGFPGGFVEKEESAEKAALRELKEEIGVPPNYVEVLAKLKIVTTTTTNIKIEPFLVLVKTRIFNLNKREVDEIYFVSFQLFEQIEPEQVTLSKNRSTIRYRLPGLVIWGATARIIKNSLEDIKKVLKEVKEK